MNLLDRLAAKSKHRPGTECLEWIGHRNEKGYGRIEVKGRMFYVHRLAMELHLGRPLTLGEVVRHKCDNPRCWNPDHLELGTIADNVADAVARNRHGTSRKRSRVLTVVEVQVIKARLSLGQSIYSIARSIGCGEQTVRDIRDRRTWKDVPTPPARECDPFR